MSNLKILFCFPILCLLLVFGPALAEDKGGDSEDTEEGGDEGAPAEEAPADEAPAEVAAPAPEPEPEPEPEPAAAPEAAKAAPKAKFTFGAHERARVRINDADDWAVENKADVSIGATFGPLYGKVMVRDHRNWGGEGVSGAFQLSEAYAGVALDNGLDIRWGRMKHNWHNGRLFGSDDWFGPGLSHDGARVTFSRDKFGMEALWSMGPERLGGDTPPPATKAHVIALRAGPRLGDALMLDAVAVVDMDLSDGAGQTRATVGAFGKGSAGIMSYQFEGYGQIGAAGDNSYGAWMAAAKASVAIDHAAKPTIGGGIDVLSGDDDPLDDKLGTFNTLFGSSHPFFGHKDRYVGGNGDAGLIDGQFNFGISPYSAMRLEVGVHAFAAMEAAEGEAFQGVELDIDMTWKPWDPMSVLMGVWVFIPPESDPEVTFLLQTDVNF
jgi:hypothetical protein